MTSWKQALQLVRFEMNYSKKYYFLQLLFIIFALYLIIPMMTEHNEGSFLLTDILFFVIIASFSQLMIPKPFKAQSISNYIWASHFIISLNQLAISKKTVIIYRYLSFMFITLTFSSLFLLLLYFFSPFLQEQMSVTTYIVFAIFWLCFSLYVGGLQPMLDTGYNFILSIIITLLLITPVIIITTLYLFYFLYPNGFLQWTIMISSKWPLLTIIGSIALAFVSCRLYMKQMEKRMNKMDYFS